MNTAIGILETKGLVGLVEATDAMAKAANVKILKRVSIGNAFVATIVNAYVDFASKSELARSLTTPVVALIPTSTA